MSGVGDEQSWIQQFLSFEGNEFFCEIDDDFINDRFNLTGLSTGPERTQDIINHITGPATEAAERIQRHGRARSLLAEDVDDKEDAMDEDSDESSREVIAQRFYGLVHARYILSMRGVQKMLAKYSSADFGRCPRALCRMQPVLPIGMHDVPNTSEVKLYCPKCEDVYHPAHLSQSSLDGAYFGTSFPAMLFQIYPKQLPRRSSEQFTLKVFGFKVHEHAQLARWQQQRREEMERKTRPSGI